MHKPWPLAAAVALSACSAVPIHGEFPLHGAPQRPVYAVTLPLTAFATTPLPGAQLVAPVDPPQALRPAVTQAERQYFGRLLGYRGAMAALEVGEPAWQQDGQLNHCASALAVPSGLRLVLWVPRERLAPVLQRPLHHRYSDGTGFDLSPGLPLGPAVAAGNQPGSHFRPLATDRFLSAAQVPDDAVGLSYEPLALPKAETESAEQWIESPDLPLGDGRLLRRPPSLNQLWSRQIRPDPADPAQRLVGLQDRCARFVVRLPASALGNAVGGFLLGALGAGASQVRGGAVITWADGALAGRTLRDTWVGRALPQRGERICFAVALFSHGSRKGAKALRPVEPGEVEVCAERGDAIGR
jgi:hypothetical protein